MIDTNNENQKLARIQRDLLLPAQTNEDNVDVVIKIRNGVIVWAETESIIKVRVDFKEIFNI
jgi:hypothetical protein